MDFNKGSKILLFGVSYVGKSTIGKMLADHLGIDFFNLDDEVLKMLEYQE